MSVLPSPGAIDPAALEFEKASLSASVEVMALLKAAGPAIPVSAAAVRAVLDSADERRPLLAFHGAIREIAIPVRWGSIPGRMYIPAGAAVPSPVVVYFHGGGFVVGSLDTHENVCRVLAADSGCAVVSVAYRLAPEWPFPAAVEDAFDSVQYVSQAASMLGLDPDRIAVAGDSAGGNLAAACLLIQGGPHVRFQLLAYPKVDIVGEYASQGEFRTVGIPDELGEFFMSSYLPVTATRSEPLASPAMAPDLRMMPPEIVLSAERDVLRDEAEAYGHALLAQGVNVAVLRAVGLPHGFLSSMSLVPSARAVARAAFTAVGQALRVDD